MPCRYILLGIDRENGNVAEILYDRRPLEDIAVFVQPGECRIGSRQANLLVAGYLDTLVQPTARSLLLCAVRNSFRRAAIISHLKHGWQFAKAVHRDAYVDPSARIGEGTIIHPRALIGSNVLVGPHAIIGPHTVLDAGVAVGAYVTTEAAVVIAAGSQIGNGCQIHAGAIISGGVKVGAWSEIAAGSVVIGDVPEGAFVAGNPGLVRQATLPLT